MPGMPSHLAPDCTEVERRTYRSRSDEFRTEGLAGGPKNLHSFHSLVTVFTMRLESRVAPPR
jgi:hypothetical protein